MTTKEKIIQELMKDGKLPTRIDDILDKYLPPRGGNRPGAGAKPKKDKKEPITVQVKKSVIDKTGGRAEVRAYLQEKINQL